MKKIISSKKKVFLVISLIHVLTFIATLVVAIIAGKNYNELLLMDDGYYYLAKNFVEGGSLTHHFVGPGLPLIYSIIHLFPEFLHPFIRLFLSISSSLGVIAITYKITENYLTPKQLFWGSLIFIFNPVYVHWIFKSSPEIFLALFLGLFIYCILNYHRSKKIKWFIFSSFAFVIGIFIKPVFLFIPFFILLISFILRRNELIIASILLITISIGSFIIFDNITCIDEDIQKSEERVYGKTSLITNSYWTNYVIKTKQFRKATIFKYEHPSNFNKIFHNTDINNYDLSEPFGHFWVSEYFDKYPQASYIKMNLDFIIEQPDLVIQKLIVSPFFFLGISAREKESFIKLFYSLFAILLSIFGIRDLLKKDKKCKTEIWIILSCIIGFSALYLVLSSINRYSLPILPYLTIWSGIIIESWSRKIKIRTNNTITHKSI